MNIVIAGVGKVGIRVTRQLAEEGHDITLIDVRQDVLDSCVEKYDVQALNGNCAAMSVLREAGIQKAQVLIVATGEDEINLLCCMTAHELNPSINTIARVRNPEYTEQMFRMRDSFGLSMIVNPEKDTAKEIERLLQYPGTLKRDTFAKGRVEIVELKVTEDSKLNGVALNAVSALVHTRVLVCSVRRSGMSTTPGGDFVLKTGDHIFITAPTENLVQMLQRLEIVKKRGRRKRVLICGGGRLGFYLAQALSRGDNDVKILERDPKRCEVLSQRLPNTTIINADAADTGVLDEEDVRHMDAIAVLTGMDEMNIIISLYCKNAGVSQVITKLGHIANSDLMDMLPLDCVVSREQLCCNHIVRYVRAVANQVGAAEAVHTIADGQAEALEFHLDENTWKLGVPLREMRLKKGVLLVCITHGATTEIPDGSSHFEKGDTVIVVASRGNAIHKFNDIFA